MAKPRVTIAANTARSAVYRSEPNRKVTETITLEVGSGDVVQLTAKTWQAPDAGNLMRGELHTVAMDIALPDLQQLLWRAEEQQQAIKQDKKG